MAAPIKSNGKSLRKCGEGRAFIADDPRIAFAPNDARCPAHEKWESEMTVTSRVPRALTGAVFATLSASMLVITPAFAQNEITIGAPLPLTGALSPEGEKLRAGYELWLQEIDKRGGIAV